MTTQLMPSTIAALKAMCLVVDSGCWEWSGSRFSPPALPYGRIGYRIGRERKTKLTHRLAYELARGSIPQGKDVLHHCDNPPCCNPAHLFLGDDKANAADRKSKGRCASGDRHGARLHRATFATANRKRAVEMPDSFCAGERNGRARLTANQVTAIRSRHAAGGVSYTDLANEYGVSHATVARVITNRGWRHVA